MSWPSNSPSSSKRSSEPSPVWNELHPKSQSDLIHATPSKVYDAESDVYKRSSSLSLHPQIQGPALPASVRSVSRTFEPGHSPSALQAPTLEAFSKTSGDQFFRGFGEINELDQVLDSSEIPPQAHQPLGPAKSSHVSKNRSAAMVEDFAGKDRSRDQSPRADLERTLEQEDVSTNVEIRSILKQFNETNQDSSQKKENGKDLLIDQEERRSIAETSTTHSPGRSQYQANYDSQTSGIENPLYDGNFTREREGQIIQEKSGLNRVVSASSTLSLRKTLPPAPESEADQPFDFHRFLSQLRHRTADPVAKYLRSFLIEFGKKQWMVHEQTKIISDFLAFIGGKMAQCEIWRDVSKAEFENAEEGMEKLVMNRLYAQTFSPVIPSPSGQPVGSSIAAQDRTHIRKGQHQEDIERDEILAQKIRIYSWVTEKHLDFPTLDDNGRRFINLAQQELLKIKNYRAPRDKVICILNCCKVIIGLLKSSKSADTSADSFIPLLIYVVLKANPENMVSNIQYILRFRNQNKLGGEAGYYISSLVGATQFIENLDRTVLTISDRDFEKNVEAAVSAIAERQATEQNSAQKVQQRKLDLAEEHYQREKKLEGSHGSHLDLMNQSPRTDQEKPAVSQFLRSIQKPLSNIGRMFSDENKPVPSNDHDESITTRDQYHREQLSSTSPQTSMPLHEPSYQVQATEQSAQVTASSQELTQLNSTSGPSEHKDIVETLASMFPNLDQELIEDVVRLKQGRVGSSVDACLALNT